MTPTPDVPELTEDSRYWVMFADETGGLMVERHGGQWVFIPNKSPGRPRRNTPEPPKPASFREVLPRGVTVDRLTIGNREFR